MRAKQKKRIGLLLGFVAVAISLMRFIFVFPVFPGWMFSPIAQYAYAGLMIFIVIIAWAVAIVFLVLSFPQGKNKWAPVLITGIIFLVIYIYTI